MDRANLELAGCLRRLFRSRYVLRSRSERWFKSIVDNRGSLEEVVARFGAALEINEPLGVCYVRAGDEDVEEQLGIRLARPKALGPYASALMLRLRWQRLQFYLQPTGDDVPVAGVKEMREYLSSFSRAALDTQFERQFRRCLDELTQLQVLVETAQDSGFYEITSLCDLLLPADQIRDLQDRATAYFEHKTPSEVPSEDSFEGGADNA
jgi:hypothetical protein